MTFWTNERIESLKALWADGWSAGRIFTEIGAASRSAVVGKVNRLELPTRPTRYFTFRPLKKAMAPRPKKPKSEKVISRSIRKRKTPHVMAPKPESVAPIILGPNTGTVAKAVLGLREHHCKFPIGDTSDPGFHFCGAPRLTTGSYCEAHTKLAYYPHKSDAGKVRSHPIAKVFG